LSLDGRATKTLAILEGNKLVKSQVPDPATKKPITKEVIWPSASSIAIKEEPKKVCKGVFYER
jgi:hypothetical protein